MKNNTIIIGAQGVGKTTFVKRLVASKKAVWLPPENINKSFSFSQVSNDTEVIVCDGCTKKNINEIKKIITASDIVIHRKMDSSITIERPELIIISNDLEASDFRSRENLRIVTIKK